MISVRGATTVLLDEKEEVLESTKELLLEVLKQNNIEIDDIISIEFTATKDITSAYPAIAARNIGITAASLMCMSEMYVYGSLEKCIRIMMLINSDKKQKEAIHVYLKEAKKLRPDLIKTF